MKQPPPRTGGTGHFAGRIALPSALATVLYF